MKLELRAALAVRSSSAACMFRMVRMTVDTGGRGPHCCVLRTKLRTLHSKAATAGGGIPHHPARCHTGSTAHQISSPPRPSGCQLHTQLRSVTCGWYSSCARTAKGVGVRTEGSILSAKPLEELVTANANHRHFVADEQIRLVSQGLDAAALSHQLPRSASTNCLLFSHRRYRFQFLK